MFCLRYDDNVKQSGVTAMAVSVPRTWDDFDVAVQWTEQFYQVAARDPRLHIVETTADIRRIKAAGDAGIIIWAQGPRAIGDRLIRLETMARLGYRAMQVTYSGRNYAGDGCNEPANTGLSVFGHELVEAMNHYGIVVDVSHAGHRTALEAARASKKPAIASHSNPYSLYPNPRNIPDEVIDAIADGGGVIGLTACVPFCWNGDPTHKPTIDDMLAAIDYIVKRVGVDHAGIGSDTIATEGAYPQWLTDELRRRYKNISTAWDRAFGPVPPKRPIGFRDLCDLPYITEGLLQRGYSNEHVTKILGGNFMRVYEAVWPK